MRTLFVTSSFPRWPGDYSGCFVLDLARGMAAAGDEVHVIAPDHPDASGASLGVAVTRVPYFWPRRAQRLFYGSGAPENLASDLGAWLQAPAGVAALAASVAKRARWFDVILAHWLVPSGLAAALGRGRGTPPLVAVAHSGDVHLLKHLPAGGRLARSIASASSSVCAIAPAVADDLGALGVEARVCPLGADLPPPSVPRDALRRGRGLAGRCVVVSVARLEPVKGLDLLVDALEGWGATTLLVAGTGSQKRALVRRARERGVDLRLLGAVAAQEKADLLSLADVVVLPSRRLANGRTEGLPVALLEALRAGAPVVVSAVGSMSEVVADAGVVVTPGDPKALARGIRAALRNAPVLRARAAERSSEYSLSRSVTRYRQVLSAAVHVRHTDSPLP